MTACPKSRLAVLAALALSIVVSPAAHAGNWDTKGANWGPNLAGVETALVGVLILDAGFGIYDLTMAGIGRPTGKGAAIAELILSVPQVVVGTAGVVYALRSDKGAAVAFGVLTLLPPGLSMHGITTLTNANQASEPIRTRETGVSAPHSEWLDSLQLRPTVIVAQRAAVPALSLGFRF